MGMAKKRTKADRLERQTEQLQKKGSPSRQDREKENYREEVTIGRRQEAAR